MRVNLKLKSSLSLIICISCSSLLLQCTNSETERKEKSGSSESEVLSREERNAEIRDQVINDLIRAEKINNYSAYIRSRSGNEFKVIVTDLYRKELGAVILTLDKDKNAIIDSDYGSWEDSSRMEPELLEFVRSSIMEVGVFGIAVDSCDNTYLKLFDANYQYVILEDSSCMRYEYSLENLRDNIYTTQYSLERKNRK